MRSKLFEARSILWVYEANLKSMVAQVVEERRSNLKTTPRLISRNEVYHYIATSMCMRYHNKMEVDCRRRLGGRCASRV